jgi:hypothetical protein
VTALWAVLRPHRIELVASLILAVAMVAIGVGTALRMAAFAIPAACFGPTASSTPGCEAFTPDKTGAYFDALTLLLPPAFAATVAVPIVAAVVLALAMVARELEQQTTVLAWSLSPSRVRWLVKRILPIAVGLIVLGLVAGLLGDVLQQLREPPVDAYRSLEGLGARGPAVAGAALLTFAIALLVGAFLGRQLPSLLVAGGLSIALVIGVSMITDQWLLGDARIADADELLFGARTLDTVVRTPEGEYIEMDEAYRRYGGAVDAIWSGGDAGGLALAIRYVPGEMYPVATARITALLAVLALACIGGTALVVNRRRPY